MSTLTIMLGRSVDRVGTADESWFLQVVERVLAGDVLYRDVFFGATPLSVYMVAGAAAVFGVDVLVLKTFIALCLTGAVLLCCRIGAQLRFTRAGVGILALALVVYLTPGVVSAYSALATVFFLGCFSAVLSWQQIEDSSGGDRAPGSAAWLALAGGAAGLAFASKQNVGVCVLAALLLAAGAEPARGGGRLGRLSLALFGFTVAALLPLLVVWWSGGMAGLLDFGFVGKGDYLQYGGSSYLAGLSGWSRALSMPTSPAAAYEQVEEIFRLQLFLLPLVAVAGLLVLMARTPSRHWRAPATVTLFVLTAMLALYPRPGQPQLGIALPAVLVGLGYVGRQWLRTGAAHRTSRFARPALTAWLVFWLIFVVNEPVRRGVGGHFHTTDLPHFKGALVTEYQARAWTAAAEELEAAAGNAPLLLLSSEAGFYYLATGLRNPTAFDFPIVTAFGRAGEQKIYAAILSGRIPTVCISYDRLPSALRPTDLIRFVEAHMDRGEELSACTIYRERVPGADL